MAQTVGSIDPSSVPGGNGGYELHQKLRTKTVRLLKKEKYNEAIDVLYDGSVRLLEMNEQGSGCDLAVYLLEAYGLSKTPVNDVSRGRITTILSKTNAEFWRKKVIQAAVKWSSTALHNTLGDAKLRLFIAELLAKDDQYFLAEGHFIAACAQDTEGVLAFAAMLNRWNAAYAAGIAKNDPKAPSADSVRRVLSGTFAMRGCFPLLVARAPDAAAQLAHEFVQEATKDNEALLLPVKPNPKEYKSPARGISSFSASIFATANPTLNFVQNVVALAGDAHSRTGQPAEEIKSAWNLLVRQFMQENGNEVESFLYEFLSQISSTYFGMAPPRRNMDMLSSMLSGIMGGGAGAPGGASSEPAVVIKQLPQPAEPQNAGAIAAKPGVPDANEADELMDDEMD